MAPKKKPKEESEKDLTAGPQFTDADRLFYEEVLAEINRELAPLRLTIIAHEYKNEQLQQEYELLEKDRNDIITYQTKCLTAKNQEAVQLKDKIVYLTELRDAEKLRLVRIIKELEFNFNTMRDQLTSEIKLLGGKLNTMDELRAVRENLMRKFNKQEKDFEHQEKIYKELIYNVEKNANIAKYRFKKEIEGQIFKLANGFQDAIKMSIASATHKAIKENITLNNTLNNLLITQEKVSNQNEKNKEDEIAARDAMLVAKTERDTAIKKSKRELKVIDKLTSAFETLAKENAIKSKQMSDFKKVNTKLRFLVKENESMTSKIRILEQNLQSCLSEENKHGIESAKIIKESDSLKQILLETKGYILAEINADQRPNISIQRELVDRKRMLKNFLAIINLQLRGMRTESMQSITSLTAVYERGDLGFVPKAKILPVLPTKAPSVSTVSSVATISPKLSKESLKKELSKSTFSSSKSSSSKSSKTSIKFSKYKPSMPSIPSEDRFSFRSMENITSSIYSSGKVKSKLDYLSSKEVFEGTDSAVTYATKLAMNSREIPKSTLGLAEVSTVTKLSSKSKGFKPSRTGSTIMGEFTDSGD